MRKIILIISALFLFGCHHQYDRVAELDAVWEKENRVLFNKIGVREYTNLTKEQAVNAMLIAFQRLDIVIDSSDYKAGIIAGSATAPKPLNYEEFESVKAVEDAIRKVQEEQWHRTKPEVVDRANSLVTSFESSIAKLEKQQQAAMTAGKADEVAKISDQLTQAQSLLDAARSGAATLG